MVNSLLLLSPLFEKPGHDSLNFIYVNRRSPRTSGLSLRHIRRSLRQSGLSRLYYWALFDHL